MDRSSFLSIGANLADPVGQLSRAADALADFLSDLAVSSLYRTEPVGNQNQPDFFNLVCVGHTDLDPVTLLAETQAIEQALGRVRSFPNGPRTIDIDLLACDDLILNTPELTLPHPRLHQRAFVLVPLAEIAPEWRHPILGRTAAELLSEAGPLERIERIGPLPGW